MTTTPINTLTLEEIRSLADPSVAKLLNPPRQIDTTDGYRSVITGKKRMFLDINGIMNGRSGVMHLFPSCYKARETVEWQRKFELAKSKMEQWVEYMPLTLDEIFSGYLHFIVQDVVDSCQGTTSFDSYLDEQFAIRLVEFWAVGDAYSVVSGVGLIDEESNRTVTLRPIGEDMYGVGGRVFAGNLWDFMRNAHAKAVSELSAEKKSKKPTSKAAAKKASRRLSKTK
jgi:hypothetical protein